MFISYNNLGSKYHSEPKQEGNSSVQIVSVDGI